MPRIRFDTQPRHYKKAVSNVNCDLLVGLMTELEQNYLQVMFLQEKIKLLEIARTVLRHKQYLPSAERVRYENIVKDILYKCRSR